MVNQLVKIDPTSARLLIAFIAVILGLVYGAPGDVFQISPSYAPLAHLVNENVLGAILVGYGILDFMAVFWWQIPHKVGMSVIGAGLWGFQGAEMLRGSWDAGFVSPGAVIFLIFAFASVASAVQTVDQEL